MPSARRSMKSSLLKPLGGPIKSGGKSGSRPSLAVTLLSPLGAPPANGAKLRRSKNADPAVRTINAVILMRRMVKLLVDYTSGKVAENAWRLMNVTRSRFSQDGQER